MSAATDCLRVLRDYRDELSAKGEGLGRRWVERCILRLQRRIGDRADLLTQNEVDSGRMPLEPPGGTPD